MGSRGSELVRLQRAGMLRLRAGRAAAAARYLFASPLRPGGLTVGTRPGRPRVLQTKRARGHIPGGWLVYPRPTYWRRGQDIFARGAFRPLLLPPHPLERESGPGLLSRREYGGGSGAGLLLRCPLQWVLFQKRGQVSNLAFCRI